ncbi:MAG: HAD family hydrolase [Planctomycetota bacterium]|nr:HAD family hydrolase [Planctomycetota bacterium]
MTESKRFIILDRDGVLNVEKGYLCDPEEVELMPGVATALKRLEELGVGRIVVTNQSGIARGYLDKNGLRAVHDRLLELLREDGASLDAIYFCPHGPDDGCDCRKPETGSVETASIRFGFDPQQAFVIGDRGSDIELGHRVGATTFLTTQGHGRQTLKEDPQVKPSYVVDGLPDAVRIIEGFYR